jgi:hypothetical protein
MIISTVILSQTSVVMMTFLWLKTILIVLPPYVLAGMAISLALTRSPWPIGLVYGVDLIGAASGCLLVLALMTWLDGASALFAVGAAAAGASVRFRIALRRSGATERLQGGWFVLRHPGCLPSYWPGWLRAMLLFSRAASARSWSRMACNQGCPRRSGGIHSRASAPTR